eukprot:92252_1
MPSDVSSSLPVRRKTSVGSNNSGAAAALHVINFEPTASYPLLDHQRSPTPRWKNGESCWDDRTTTFKNNESDRFQQQQQAALTYEVEDDDRELLPHAYLDLDGRDDDKYTSTTKLSTTDLLGSILYCSSSFAAVAWPVGIAMALSGIATTHFTSQRTAEEQSEQLSAYELFSIHDDDTRIQMLGEAFVNALLIVLVMGTLTFGIVLLYRYQCMFCLKGYLIFSSIGLLGSIGGFFFYTLLDTSNTQCDIFSFMFIMWNFTVVGVISIFFPMGLPTFFTQGYLILTSVIMAWQLSRFDEWTGWALLVLLAFYDCCAVLSPYGPLNALVSLMQEKQEPMPGLLYEADLPTHGPLKEQLVHYDSSSERYYDYSDDSSPMKQKESFLPMKSANEDEDIQETDGGKIYNTSIKLGLGDFCFYSMLVAKASQFDFVAGTVCLYVVLLGLCITLCFLSLTQSALPALPISIVFGVMFYILTLWALQPFVVSMIFSHGAYL